MTRKIFLPLVLLVSITIFINYYANPPDGYTGAPVSDELSCTICHYYDTKNFEGYTEIKGLPTKINAGEIYPIEIHIHNEDKKAIRTAFQFVALKEEESIGELSNPNERVKFSTYKIRTYAESNGGKKIIDGEAIFKFDWIAPDSSNNCIVSFYSTAMIADGDNTFVNDKVVYASASGIIGNSLDVIITNQINNLCRYDSVGSVDIDVTGGNPPYTYIWSNEQTNKNISNLKAGIYYVTTTDQDGMNGIGFAKITQPNLLEITNITIEDYSLNQTGSIAIDIDGGSGDYSFSWTKEGINISNQQNIDNLLPGCYNVFIEDSCNTKLDSTICIKDITSTIYNDIISQIEIYPNPANKIINLNLFGNQFDKYEIVNMSGEILSSSKLINSKKTIDISKFKSGLYILKLTIKKKTINKKFLILH